jgi:hypothetical protein
MLATNRQSACRASHYFHRNGLINLRMLKTRLSFLPIRTTDKITTKHRRALLCLLSVRLGLVLAILVSTLTPPYESQSLFHKTQKSSLSASSRSSLP